jgi:hypothetical protein
VVYTIGRIDAGSHTEAQINVTADPNTQSKSVLLAVGSLTSGTAKPVASNPAVTIVSSR